MHNRLKNPCNDCPFRRNAVPGWLGASRPEWFVESALSDFAEYAPGAPMAPCHQTVNYEDDDWLAKLSEADACVGALQFAANNCKSPRDPERSAAVRAAGQNPDVFRTSQEFIDYHTQGAKKDASDRAA